MITDEHIEIKITLKNINHFIKYYKYIKLKDIIKVKPEELQKNSNVKVNVKCDICGLERRIKYQAYYKNINSCEEYHIYTCDKCSHVKIKSFNQKKWGVDYFSQTNEYTIKFKNTMMERYGVEYTLQSEELKNKAKKTNLKKFGYENIFKDKQRMKNIYLEKWGVDHPSKVEKIKNKIEQTNLKKFGYKYALSSPEIRDKITLTNNKKYGGHPMKNEAILNKLIKTNLAKYGYKYTFNNPDKINDIKKSNLLKWGVENYMMLEEIRDKFIISNDPNYIKYIGNSISQFICEKGHLFEINIDNYHSRKKNNTPLCTICNPIGDSRSIKEKQLVNYIKEIYNNTILENYRNGLEIDIYLPDLKLGFEFNGLYWHSELYRDKNYHLDKTNYFKEKGIQIIHIWEDNWDFKNEIIKSQISNWLGMTKNKIFARKCEIKEIKSSNKFLNKNHIQGSDRSSIKIGLFYNDDMVSIMTFDKFEGRKKMSENEWNLSRFCNKLEYNIIGGASKLLSYFITKYQPQRIVSYADQDWSNGNLYYKLGFNLVSISKADYKYIFNSKRIHKSRFKKSKLHIDESISESEFMKKSHILKIWDCGKIKFEFISIQQKYSLD